MWYKLLNSLKKNLIWLILLAIFFVPHIRIPLQIYANKGFSYLNRINVETVGNASNLNELVLLDEFGNSISGSDLDEKVVFINFWATWCPPCIAEMSSIQELYNDYNSNVEFLIISNETFERMSKFKMKEGYTFEAYRPKQIPEEIYGRSIPRTLIIDPKGNIRVEKSGAVNWNSTEVRKLLDELLKESI